MPVEEVRALCHEILMRMLPGIVERDLDLFGSSVNAIQGLGFKKVELSLQPDEVPALIETVRSAGAAGAGMSLVWPHHLRNRGHGHAGNTKGSPDVHG